MYLQQIRAFIALAEELHFTRAAERLGISQPQLSQLIRRLEQDLEAQLVERTTRRVVLTTTGQAVLPHARQALQEMRLMQRSAKGWTGDVQGTVRLGYAGASSRPWLPPIARRVREDTPGVELRLQSMIYGAQGPGRIVSGDLDIVFSRRPLKHPGLLDRIFEYEEILVGLPSDHRLAGVGEVALTDLRDEPWVMFPGAYGSNVREIGFELAREAGFEPNVVQEAPDSYTILGLVAAGVGVTVTVSSVRHIRTPGLKFLPLAGERQFSAATVVWSAHAHRATLAVIDAIEKVAPTPRRPRGKVLQE
jgi:DNA-binding transcriptional LysR family regulator